MLIFLSILLSNTYETILTNDFMRVIMSEFVMYNKVMLYLPQFVGLVSLFCGVIAFMGTIKSRNYEEVNYGDF